MKIIEEIKKSQKNIQDPIYIFFTKKYSKYFTALCYFLRISPNNLTLSMFLFGIIGGYLFTRGTPSAIQIGALSFLVLNLCDTSDGELARLVNKTSEAGEKLDKLVHLFTNPFMIVCLGICLWMLTNSTAWLYYSAVTNSFYVMASELKKYRKVDITKRIGKLYFLPKLLFDFQAFWHITFVMMSLLLILKLNLMPLWIFYCAFFYLVIIIKSIVDLYLFFKTSGS